MLELSIAHAPMGAYAALGQLVIMVWIVTGCLLLIPLADLIFWRWGWLGVVDGVLLVGAWGVGIWTLVTLGNLVLVYIHYPLVATVLFLLARWRRRRRRGNRQRSSAKS